MTDQINTCPDCAGTGFGHPDNTGYRCHRCGGTGGVPETTGLDVVARADKGECRMTNETPITDPLQIVEEINRRFAEREDWALDTPDQLPALKAADGFKVSVQASEYHYCQPRKNIGPYSHVECGFPTELPMAWAEWAETPDTVDTVFAYMPLIDVAREFARRGGLV